MTLIQEWVDDINVEVPACLEATASRAVKFAIQEFFTDSECWRHIESISLADQTTEYLLILPDNTYSIANDYAKVYYDSGNIELLDSVKMQDVKGTEGRNPSKYATSDASLFVDSSTGEGNLELGLILQPTRNIEEVPTALANKHFEAIRNGALMRLKSMTEKDWSDPNGAAKHGAMFYAQIDKARREAKKTRSRVRKPAKFNKGFAW